jgi:hypothetical protein
MAGGSMNLDKANNERRATDRFPIERDVRYKVLNYKSDDEVGIGKTINMSSRGVLFTTDRHVALGKKLEVSISWPAQLNSAIPLKLVASGRVIRAEQGIVAMEIQHTEFRTQANTGLTT